MVLVADAVRSVAAQWNVLLFDATAIALTPIVYRAIAKQDGDAMPFLMSCTFVADTASFGLPFANPANVLIMPHARLLPYLVHLGPPQPASAAALRTMAVVLGVVIVYVVALALGGPLGPVAAIGAVVALAAGGVPLRDALRHVSKSTFAILAALFVLLGVLERAGFVRWALAGLDLDDSLDGRAAQARRTREFLGIREAGHCGRAADSRCHGALAVGRALEVKVYTLL